MRKSVVVLVLAFCAACGGSQPSPATPGPEATGPKGHGEHQEGGHKEAGEAHANLKPTLKDFHEVLAPIWHTTPGAERVAKACTGEKALREKATAVGDADLTAATAAIGPACEKEGKPDVEARLGTVHQRFHALTKN